MSYMDDIYRSLPDSKAYTGPQRGRRSNISQGLFEGASGRKLDSGRARFFERKAGKSRLSVLDSRTTYTYGTFKDSTKTKRFRGFKEGSAKFRKGRSLDDFAASFDALSNPYTAFHALGVEATAGYDVTLTEEDRGWNLFGKAHTTTEFREETFRAMSDEETRENLLAYERQARTAYANSFFTNY